MQDFIEHRPSYALLQLDLEPGESVRAEAGDRTPARRRMR